MNDKTEVNLDVDNPEELSLKEIQKEIDDTLTKYWGDKLIEELTKPSAIAAILQGLNPPQPL